MVSLRCMLKMAPQSSPWKGLYLKNLLASQISVAKLLACVARVLEQRKTEERDFRFWLREK